MEQPTIFSALKSRIPYPLDETFIQSVMVERGLDDGPYSREISESVAWKGSLSDCLSYLWHYPQSVSEGGVSITKGDLSVLKSEVNRLRREIGEPLLDADQRPLITAY